MLKQRIIDCHSHIGTDNAWEKTGSLLEYIRIAKSQGITESLLMPVPMPIISIGQYRVTPIMIGTDGENDYIVQGVENSSIGYGIPIAQNPYKYANLLLYQSIDACKNAGIKLHFIPLIHPVFDTIEYLELLLISFNPIALKVHGYSSLISPYEISNEFWELIHYYNIPLIIHTDCDTSGNDNSIDTYLRNENSPLNWLHLLQKYSIRAYLTHGVRLCEESCKIINESSNLVVGLGPDGLLSTCKGRMYSDKPYLETLFSKVNKNKICFDLDYPWNVDSYENPEFDWDSLNRIKALGLTDSELEKVLYENAKNFFNL